MQYRNNGYKNVFSCSYTNIFETATADGVRILDNKLKSIHLKAKLY